MKEKFKEYLLKVSIYSMNKNTCDFFCKQTEITKQKLELYNWYIEKFAITLLMATWKIFIADLFSWAWYNWSEKWSPLLLIDILNKLLTDNTLLNKYKYNSPQVFLLFNDKNNIEELKQKLENYEINKNINIQYQKKDFKDILSDITTILTNTKIHKFFFLDQYSYSTVSFQDIKNLFLVKNTEILLFSPVMDLYRFVNASNILNNKEHKTRKVIEDFTEKWVWNHYEKDIHKLCEEIILKMRKDLNSNYIRYVLLDDWKRKNALFYISWHILWLIKFNGVASKLWDYWIWKIDIKKKKEEKKENYQIPLFWEKVLDNKCIDKLCCFKEDLIKLLQNSILSNVNIIEFAAINWVLISDVKEILKNLYKDWKLEIEYVNWWSTRSIYIAEWNRDKIKCNIKYKS